MVANWITTAITAAFLLVFGALPLFFRWIRHRRKMKFFGISADRPVVQIFTSRLDVMPGGTRGVEPISVGFTGPAISHFEYDAAHKISELLSGPSSTLPHWWNRIAQWFDRGLLGYKPDVQPIEPAPAYREQKQRRSDADKLAAIRGILGCKTGGFASGTAPVASADAADTAAADAIEAVRAVAGCGSDPGPSPEDAAVAPAVDHVRILADLLNDRDSTPYPYNYVLIGSSVYNGLTAVALEHVVSGHFFSKVGENRVLRGKVRTSDHSAPVYERKRTGDGSAFECDLAIVRRIDTRKGNVIVICAGIGGGATLGSAEYLIRKWDRWSKKFLRKKPSLEDAEDWEASLECVLEFRELQPVDRPENRKIQPAELTLDTPDNFSVWRRARRVGR